MTDSSLKGAIGLFAEDIERAVLDLTTSLAGVNECLESFDTAHDSIEELRADVRAVVDNARKEFFWRFPRILRAVRDAISRTPTGE